MIICLISTVIAYLVRFNFNVPEVETATFYYVFPLILSVRAASFFILGYTPELSDIQGHGMLFES